MDPYAVLANQYAKSATRDLGHSALPNAPVQPYVDRRRRVRRAVAWFRTRKVPMVSTKPRRTSDGCALPDLRSP